MRVGLVIYGDLAHGSGGFLYDRMLVETLRQAGDTVDVISLPWKGYGRCIFQSFEPQLRARLAGWDGDILLQDELVHPSLFLLNRRLLKARQVPLISIVHHLRTSEGPEERACGLYRKVERAYLRTVDGFLFNSEVTRRTVEDLTGERCRGLVVTPAGDRLGPGPGEQEIRRRAAEPGPLRVLFVGNLIPRKGLLTLLEALGRLPREKWRLSVVGSPDVDPGHAARVRRFIERNGMRNNVSMRGQADDAALAAALRTHHVLAVPSRYEGFGIVYLEAMGFGVVPIGSSAGGAAEIIRDGTSGCLVPPDSASALAAAIERLCEDRGHLQALGRGALARFREFPGWKQGMAAAREHLRSLVREKEA